MPYLGKLRITQTSSMQWTLAIWGDRDPQLGDDFNQALIIYLTFMDRVSIQYGLIDE